MRTSLYQKPLWLLLLFLLLACEPDQEPGLKVIGIMDGDTIEVLDDKNPVRVRLYGVDAPEKNQDYGTRARQFASDLAFGKNVRLIEKGKDRYGRVIGIILLPDGRSLNEELVRNGYAWYYREYANDPVLDRLEADARQERRGLWELPNPTPPWEFRKERRSGAATASQPKTAKQPSARQSSTQPARIVFFCDSKGATAYHTSSTCPALKRCKSEVKRVALQQAEGSGRNLHDACVSAPPN